MSRTPRLRRRALNMAQRQPRAMSKPVKAHASPPLIPRRLDQPQGNCRPRRLVYNDSMKLIAALLAFLMPCLAAGPQVDKAKALGNPAAPVEIEVWGSFDCPHCKVLHETTVPMLMKDYVSTGKVYLVSREFPLWGQYHPYAWQAAQYATAAARVGKYQQVTDALFNNQQAWGATGKVWEAVATVLTPAEQKKVQ